MCVCVLVLMIHEIMNYNYKQKLVVRHVEQGASSGSSSVPGKRGRLGAEGRTGWRRRGTGRQRGHRAMCTRRRIVVWSAGKEAWYSMLEGLPTGLKPVGRWMSTRLSILISHLLPLLHLLPIHRYIYMHYALHHL